jgi:hypothetical protein
MTKPGVIETRCVYTTPEGLCDGSHPLSKNEHYFPRALGNFENNNPLVDRICDGCQRVCSQLEDVLAHNSPEAFFREMIGRVGRKKRDQKSIFYDPTFGIPPLAMYGKHPGHDFEILWELVTKDGCAPMSQLVFLGNDGKTLHLPFRKGRWTAGKIRALLKERGVRADQIVVFSNTEEESVEMNALTDQLAPKGKDLPVAQLINGAKIDGQMKVQMTEKYIRAIAKIGFHFFLMYFPHFSGLEREFDDVKRFIYTGIANRQIVERSNEPFLLDLQQGARVLKWGHLVSAEYGAKGMVARMQFFVGPAVQPFVWIILIDPSPRRDAQATGSAFIYFDDLTGDYHGERFELKAL